jgi:hypothetical protein
MITLATAAYAHHTHDWLLRCEDHIYDRGTQNFILTLFEFKDKGQVGGAIFAGRGCARKGWFLRLRLHDYYGRQCERWRELR